MDSARADALAARSHLERGGWIPRNSEPFRHLLPPQASVWLGDEPDAACTASRLEGGWQLHPVPTTPGVSVEARWLDAADAGQRRELLAGLPSPGDGPAAPYAWAHRALVRDGLRLRVGGQARGDAPVWLRLDRRPGAAVEAPLLVIELLPGARCVLVESHERDLAATGGACSHGTVQNLQVHVRLAAGATLQHLRLALPGADDHIAHHVDVRLERDAVYQQCLLAGGSRYHLQRLALDLDGARASARAASVLLAADTALDQQVQVRHAAPHTRSSMHALALGSGKARMVANAHAAIEPGCDEAQVRQRLAGIPTGGQPKLVLRPHLEIHHDQVQASHGATWGALPPEALFHARQRGLDERAAKAMILQGLAGAALAGALGEQGVLEEAAIEQRLAHAVERHLAAESREPSHG
ncbi:SufBD protein [Ramlibacter sp. RBP-2]|uniref:SufBD protein n=1 Tax=Ramlibacter lithotrophicus TaxID=2606681 RepID=A0A7X6I6S1_9BURK|nr:SufD family Fe-S cluster assembly protein [Ramlibacter lithotrophicus]NKE66550.1 SufBD protein [Ramlibacter lithotrophicus]